MCRYGVPAVHIVTLEELNAPETQGFQRPSPSERRSRSSCAESRGTPGRRCRGQAPDESVADHRAGRAAAGHRSLAEGRITWPDADGRLPPAREDHSLRPRADPRAGRARPRSGRARHLHGVRERRRRDQGRLPAARPGDSGLRAVLDRPGFAWIGRHRPRRPRLRGEVLHRRRQLRPGRQQHARLLHPGRDQVPRHHPRRQTASRPGDPAGADGPRHVLGLRLAAHRGDPPRHVGDVRPRHPALLPDDGGLRRPHLPPRQRQGRDLSGEIPLEAGRRRSLARLGRGADRGRCRSGLPPPRHGRRHRRRRAAGVRARPAGHARLRGPDLRGDRPARPDEDRPRGALPGTAGRQAHPRPQSHELLRRDRAGRLPHRQPGAWDRGHRRPVDAGPAVLVPRHPADPPRRPELHPAADQLPARRGERQPPRRHAPDRGAPGHRAVPAEQSRRSGRAACRPR